MTNSAEFGRVPIGCTFNFLWLPLLGAVVTAVIGGPWWVLLSCLAIMLLGHLWAMLATGLLVYFTWDTSWMVIPLLAFVGSTLLAIRSKPSRLHDRGVRSFALHARTNKRRHLRQAVGALRRAAALATPYDPNRGAYMTDYAMTLVALHEREDRPGVLEYAERLCREALALLPSDHPHRGRCLNGLSSVLLVRCKLDNDLAVLDEAVRLGREAVAAPHSDDQTAVLSINLANTLLMLYQRNEDPQALTEALRACRDAVAAIPPGSPYAHGLLGNLSGALLLSYSVKGELAALEEAVQLGRQVAAAARANSLLVDSSLVNLAVTLVMLFERTRRTGLLDEAAELAHGALAVCPPDHPEREKFLNTLGSVLWVAAEQGDRPDLADEAVTALLEAVTLLPEGHVNQAARLGNLCAALVTSFTVHKRPGDLAAAVGAGRDSFALTPHDDPGRASTLLALGRALEAQYDHSGSAILAESCRTYAEAADSTSSPVSIRNQAARKATEGYIRAQDHGSALAMAELAVGQIPRIAPQRLGFDDRLHRAASMAGLAATAAEAAIGVGEPGRAVELLEQARGVVLGGAFDLRGDFTELRSRAPGLARELDDLVGAIERADAVPLFAAPGHEELSDLRTRLNGQWDELLARIRRHTGLRDFLLPPPIERLREQAAEGPIACVIAHREHGSALIVTDDPSEPVVVVDLPLLTQQAVDERVAALDRAQQAATGPGTVTRRRQAQQDMLRILDWLWDAVAAPVLDALDLTRPPADGQSWPRIWWCPVGPCALLPLHAAGRHADGRHDNVMDRVISSYTTTIRALAHARGARPGTHRTPSTLVVSVPEAPDASPLPGATVEADLLDRLLPATTVLHSPDRAAVTAALPNHEITHFACHGVADMRTPTDSRLLLHDYLDEPLTVTAISRLRLDRGELAYLSACSTAHTTATYADEAVHLTAALQLAGYRSVVGTLWPVNDRAAVAIAEDFYTHVARPGTTTPAPTAAATALHYAVNAYRARYPALPTQWASHIHHGA
jgi:hypothetical protein